MTVCNQGVRVALGLLLFGGCAGDAPTGGGPTVALASKTWQSLDQRLAVDLPMDLLVQVHTRGVLATSSDGGYRFYLGAATEASLPEQLGAMKDELIGLGYDVEGEQHFESAVRIELTRGRGPNRSWRTTWILDVQEPHDGAAGHVIVCEGIAREAHRARLGDPLRATCQGVRRSAQGPGAVRAP